MRIVGCDAIKCFRFGFVFDLWFYQVKAALDFCPGQGFYDELSRVFSSDEVGAQHQAVANKFGVACAYASYSHKLRVWYGPDYMSGVFRGVQQIIVAVGRFAV